MANGSGRIDLNSWVSIGVLGSIIIAVATGTSWATRIDTRLEAIESKIEQRTEDRWTGRDMLQWSGGLRERNPDLVVPLVIRENE